ncbi:MAG: hypothetical protein DDT26_02209 [Dehalococcoidia bacterium]|nr:hypothetical protein [Chloroflexota bacterium]MBT9166290.1 hypothetical protein [Chloroflexota bacterium]
MPQREVTRKTKGLACEGKATAYMLMMGFDLISVDLDIPQGLDGVFEHDGENPGRNVTAPVVFDPVSSKPPPYPKFVVLEAKYDGTGTPSGSKKGKLKKTQSGRQGSKKYVEGPRLRQAVGKGKAKEIRDHNNFFGTYRKFKRPFRPACRVGFRRTRAGLGAAWAQIRPSTRRFRLCGGALRGSGWPILIDSRQRAERSPACSRPIVSSSRFRPRPFDCAQERL